MLCDAAEAVDTLGWKQKIAGPESITTVKQRMGRLACCGNADIFSTTMRYAVKMRFRL